MNYQRFPFDSKIQRQSIQKAEYGTQIFQLSSTPFAVERHYLVAKHLLYNLSRTPFTPWPLEHN